MDSLRLFVKQKRKELKLTQEDVALSAGVGLRFVRDLEQGKKTLRVDKINDVLALFGKEVGVIDKPRDSGKTKRNFTLLYSSLKLSTGFTTAALMACELTVTSAITSATIPASANIHHCISTR